MKGLSKGLRVLRLLMAAMLLLTASFVRAEGKFAWGADIGTSVDLTGHDMSTVNLDANFGYANGVLQMVGVGAGAHMMVSNGCRAFPIYAILQTNFRQKPSLCFLDLRVGIAVNNVDHDSRQTVPYINPSIGFNLAGNKTFQSYMRIGYLYNGMKSFGPEENRTTVKGGLSMVNVAIGISF